MVSGSRPRSTTIERVRVWAAAGFWFALIAVVSFGLRWPFLSVPLNADEGGYAYVASRWLYGRGDLYNDLWISRPQGIFLAYGAIFETLGTSVTAIHLGAWLIGLATTIFVWLFARLWLGDRAAVVAVALFTLINGSPYLEGYTANAEVFMAFPAAIAAWLLLRWSRNPERTAALPAIGVLVAIATLLKPSGVVMLPLAWAFIWLLDNSTFRARTRRSVWVVSGFVLGMVPALIHGWMTGWHDFVFASVSYRLEFQSSATVSLTHHWDRMMRLVRHCRALFAMVGLLVGVRWVASLSWPPLAAPWWAPRVSGLVAEPRLLGRFSPRTDVETGWLLLRLWIVACLIGIAMGGDWWYHYLIQMAAPLAIWFAATLRGLDRILARHWRHGVIVAVVALLIGQYWVAALGSPERISTWLYHRNELVAADDVAAYLRAHSPSDTSVYVAFSQPAISYLADRASPYRYLYPQELGALPEAQADLIAMVEAPDRPLYIVAVGRGAPFPDGGRSFWTSVATRYTLEATIGGLGIYRANQTTELTPKP